MKHHEQPMQVDEMSVKEGVYRAELSSLLGKGSLDLTVGDGKVEGRDDAFRYVGTYRVTGGAVEAKLEVRKFNLDNSNPNIFGNDNDNAVFKGTIDGDIIYLVGRGEMPLPEVRAKLTWLAPVVRL